MGSHGAATAVVGYVPLEVIKLKRNKPTSTQEWQTPELIPALLKPQEVSQNVRQLIMTHVFLYPSLDFKGFIDNTTLHKIIWVAGMRTQTLLFR